MFFDHDSRWQRAGEVTVERLLARFGQHGLHPERFGLVVLRERQNARPVGYAWRGDWQCYPCSLVKVFHLIHVLNVLDAGRIEPHEDLDRALHDMIVWSSNMATNYVIDLITETTGDTLLDSDALTQWMEKRNETNRFFRRLGWEEFATSNIAQKLMDDTRYGREAQFAGRKGENLNVLTPLVAARAFHELFDGIIPLSAESRVRAMDTLRRNPDAPDAALPGYQLREYLGGGIPAGVPIWSKAGRNSWTGDANASYFKHDLVRLAPANADPMIIALMTQGKSLCDDLPMAFPEMGQIIFETFSDATSR